MTEKNNENNFEKSPCTFSGLTPLICLVENSTAWFLLLKKKDYIDSCKIIRLSDVLNFKTFLNQDRGEL